MRSLFHVPAATGLFGRARPQTRAGRVVSNWLARRRSRRTLAVLDAHLLRDLGLTYEAALHEASKPFWRD
jgi:uncharacterized protein YjiS (DUF1127 family)